MKHIKKYFFVLMLLALAASAEATLIDINTNDYTGNYSIVGELGATSGNTSVNLVAGNYTVIVGAVSSFQIEVDIDGNVAVPNGASASGGGATLTFNTQTLSIDSGLYSGRWSISDVTPGIFSNSDVVLVKGQNYNLQIAAVDSFLFTFDSSGDVSFINKPGVATYTTGVLQFHSTQVNVDVGLFSGGWAIELVTPFTFGAFPSVQLVPNIKYQIIIDSTGSFVFEVDANGLVTVPNQLSALGGQNSLTFDTFAVDVDPNGFLGAWAISNITAFRVGTLQNISLVKGITYRMDLDNNEVSSFYAGQTCESTPTEITFSNNVVFSVSCHVSTPVFACLPKTDYSQPIVCNGTVTVKNQNELNQYLTDYGFSSGAYRNLTIDFNVDGAGLQIHSPCNLSVHNNRQITSENLCLDARLNINLKKNFVLQNANTSYLISQSGKVEINKDSVFQSPNIYFSAGESIRIKKNVEIQSGVLSFFANQKVALGPFTVHSNNTDITSNGQIILQNGSLIFSTNELVANAPSCVIQNNVTLSSLNTTGSCF